ncbi:GntR family transcriptional regulator (plasmid) [Skermanella mucosa]|uniref:GntR family transcriptional regulator n=1 Tax=Skermanella mucosa TaxID=1789672 RepID=UPI00192C1E8A|nr:GntR family transcriptional regulator [Skermanella mucosa]UEM24418.1 GntR family transcriptional regulator [Skermanella mucosa]
MSETKRKESQATAADRAYQHIRSGISSGELKIGDHLREEALALSLGVSRTPIRAALQKLAGEGFVTFQTHLGAVVKGWSRRDVIETFEIRAELEAMAARRAARNASKADIEALHALCTAMEKVVTGEREIAELSQLNKDFHVRILRMADHRRLESLVNGLTEMGFLVRSYSKFDQAALARSISHHRDIVTAIAQGNGEWAAAIMKAHILAATSIYQGNEEG